MEANKVPDSPTGNYSLPSSYKVANGDTSDVSQHNPPLEDIAAALSARLSADGRKAWTGNQNANGNKLTGLADGTSPGDAVALGQIGPIIGGSTEKASIVDDDRIAISDSEDSQELKYSKWSSLKTALGSLFDAKLNKSGGTLTGRLVSEAGHGNNPIGTETISLGNIAVRSEETGAAAAMAFFNGPWAVYFGLDTDNKLKVGGWSMGNNAYEIYHEGNLPPLSPVGLYTGSSAGETDFPLGHIVNVEGVAARNSSATVRLAPTVTEYTSSGSGSQLAGTWRARGRTVVGSNQAFLAQRVA